MDDFMMINLDDYHNIHTKRRGDTTTTSDVLHFQTILLKAVPGLPAVPFNNPHNGKNIHNPKGIDAELIVENFQVLFFPHLWLTYNERKLVFAKELHEARNHEERVEMLLVHNYDDRIQQRREDRSMSNTKLVNLVEGSLHSTKDYIKGLENLFNVPELETYLESYVLPGSFDYPGQIHGRRAVSASFNLTNIHQLSPLLQHIVPMIGPLHVSLNSRETVFKLNYSFFNKLNCFLYLKKRPLANKPKPYKINVLLELTASGWNLIREEVLIKFRNCKDPEARYLLDLIDNIIPLVLDFYPVIFRSGSWSAYREAMFRAWVLFYRYGRKNYNKVPLAFFSDVFYWFTTHHPMAHTIEQNIHLFNDYYVENFHSSLRLQTNASNSAEQIIRQAKIIDQSRGSNIFKENFSDSHNITYNEKELEFMKKRVAVYLLELFTDVYSNIGKTTIDTSGKYKKPKYKIPYKLPTLDTVVDVKMLPLAWNSSSPPKTDKYCDLDGCELSHVYGCTLACGHSYHYECFLLNLSSQCHYCNDLLKKGIIDNSNSFQNSVSSFDDLDLEENEEDNIIETSDDESISLDSNIDSILNNHLLSFKILGTI
jgi:hypothetical protein